MIKIIGSCLIPLLLGMGSRIKIPEVHIDLKNTQGNITTEFKYREKIQIEIKVQSQNLTYKSTAGDHLFSYHIENKAGIKIYQPITIKTQSLSEGVLPTNYTEILEYRNKYTNYIKAPKHKRKNEVLSVGDYQLVIQLKAKVIPDITPKKWKKPFQIK